MFKNAGFLAQQTLIFNLDASNDTVIYGCCKYITKRNSYFVIYSKILCDLKAPNLICYFHKIITFRYWILLQKNMGSTNKVFDELILNIYLIRTALSLLINSKVSRIWLHLHCPILSVYISLQSPYEVTFIKINIDKKRRSSNRVVSKSLSDDNTSRVPLARNFICLSRAAPNVGCLHTYPLSIT